jgi:hypothetical protein
VIELEETLGMISEMAVVLREQLMAVLPDFGQHLGFDGTDIASHSTGQTQRVSGQTSDPDADWGHHATQGVDERTGKAWKKIKRWFGYGLHLIADTHYEIPPPLAWAARQCARRRSRDRGPPGLWACAESAGDRSRRPPSGSDCAQARAAVTRGVKWTLCPGQFSAEFKLVRLLRSQRFGAAPGWGSPLR